MAAWPAYPQLKVGQPAPEIKLDQLLPDQPVERASLSSLKGKAIVVEFWSTTCSICVDAIPHLNQLAASFKDQPVVFLSVADQDRATIEPFLVKHPILGWVGIAKDSGLFKAYNVDGLPRTFLIDREGRLAGDVFPYTLKDTMLNDLIAGTPLKLPKPVTLTIRREGDDPGLKPILDAVIRPAADPSDHGAMGTGVGRDERFMGGKNGTLKRFLMTAYRMPGTRMFGEPLEDRSLYDLSIHLATSSDEAMRNLYAAVVCAAFHVTAVKETRELDVLVLTAPHGKPDVLTEPPPPPATGGQSFRIGRGPSTSGGAVRMTDSPVEGLARVLESALGKPVLDETRLTGRYNLQLPYAKDTPGALEDAIRKAGFGLEAVKRPVEVLVVTKAE